jgi:hypothetical protein
MKIVHVCVTPSVMDIGTARNGGRLLHGLAASYSRIKKSYWGITMAKMVLPDIDLEGRVVIMTGADREPVCISGNPR